MSERAAHYAAEAGLVDRGARWRQRLAEVEAVGARRRRRARIVASASWGTSLVAGVVLGWAILGWRGVLAAVGVVAITAAGTAGARALARRRGASAWDWQAQRYRLLGDPSAEVQRRDRPPSQRPTDRR